MSKYEFQILATILNQLNPNLEAHGKRVMYLFDTLYKKHKLFSIDMLNKLRFLCLYHDIGATKTENFNDFSDFHITNSYDYSIYGSLFIKYFSPFPEEAEIIANLHKPYEEIINNPNIKYKTETLLLSLCDGIDLIALSNISSNGIIDILKENLGNLYAPNDIELFISAEKENNLIEDLRTKTADELCDMVEFDDLFSYGITANYIKMLIYVNDLRSESTVIHTIFSITVSKLLADFMALDAEAVSDIQIAALLHDIGKINIPAEILDKPSALNEYEYEIVYNHIHSTKEFFDRNPIFSERIVNAALNHHERLDGSGYPRHLKAKDLPILDRIIQIADVISSLWEEKTYKKGYMKSKVLEILNEEAKNGRLDKDIILLINEYHDYIKSTAIQEAYDALDRYNAFHKEYREIMKEK